MVEGREVGKRADQEEVVLDNICIIADILSSRYRDLQNELACLTRFVISPSKIKYLYKYYESNITDNHYYSFWTWPEERISVTGWLEGNIILNKRLLSLCLNHLCCLTVVGQNHGNNWSLICEDDFYIPNKKTFTEDFLSIISDCPDDADIIWISSGKKPLDCTYRNVCGYDSQTELTIVNDRFVHVQKSRYADCFLIRSNAARFLQEQLISNKIGLPIDWEFNYILQTHPEIKSYWLTPAIVRQNPAYLTT